MFIYCDCVRGELPGLHASHSLLLDMTSYDIHPLLSSKAHFTQVKQLCLQGGINPWFEGKWIYKSCLGLTFCRRPQVWLWQRVSAESGCGSPSTKRWGSRSLTPLDIAPSETGRISYPQRLAVVSAKYRRTKWGTGLSKKNKNWLLYSLRNLLMWSYLMWQ